MQVNQELSAVCAAAGGATHVPATHEVKLVLVGTAYKYVPNKLTIQSGDVIKFTSVSGGPHNVQFYPDSIPANASGPIKALAIAPPEKGGNIVIESMKMDGESVEVSFAGAPPGVYKFFCAPHHALGMTGEVTVQ